MEEIQNYLKTRKDELDQSILSPYKTDDNWQTNHSEAYDK